MLAATALALPAESQPVPPQRADASMPASATATTAPSILDGHRSWLQELLHLETARDEAPPRRRSRRQRQQARQRLQQRIRREAVGCYHHLREQGCRSATICPTAICQDKQVIRKRSSDVTTRRVRCVPNA
jgi:hypothetical protein